MDNASPSCVLVPYKITLLSNTAPGNEYRRGVLVPYKITLLSNQVTLSTEYGDGFSTL